MKTASLVCRPKAGRKTNDFFLQYQTRGFLSLFNLLADHLSQLGPPGPVVTLITLLPAIQQTHSGCGSRAWRTVWTHLGFCVGEGLDVLPTSFCVRSAPACGSWLLGGSSEFLRARNQQNDMCSGSSGLWVCCCL